MTEKLPFKFLEKGIVLDFPKNEKYTTDLKIKIILQSLSEMDLNDLEKFADLFNIMCVQKMENEK